MTNEQPIVYKIRELDPDMIAPSTRKMNEKGQGGSKIAFIGKTGCMVKDTKILMYDGTMKNIQDIRIGEKLMGDDSTPRTVLELFQGVDQNMYKIIPNNGDNYTVNSDHILSLKNDLGHITDISVKEYLETPLDFKKKWKWFKVAVDFPINTTEDCSVLRTPGPPAPRATEIID